ncbi:MAG: cytochrome c [Sulfurovum sp.]|nr:cytochrome c [Sulfurovum sp.]
MRILVWFLIPLLLCSTENETESFITDYEYGEMLYSNPRGVSCAECHGDSGQGKSIVHYQDIHGNQELRGSDIRTSTLAQMIAALNGYHEIMPRYYLTDDEVEAMYKYLQKKYKKI